MVSSQGPGSEPEVTERSFHLTGHPHQEVRPRQEARPRQGSPSTSRSPSPSGSPSTSGESFHVRNPPPSESPLYREVRRRIPSAGRAAGTFDQTAAPASVQKPEIASEGAVLMDAATGTIPVFQEQGQTVPIRQSITSLMTAACWWRRTAVWMTRSHFQQQLPRTWKRALYPSI